MQVKQLIDQFYKDNPKSKVWRKTIEKELETYDQKLVEEAYRLLSEVYPDQNITYLHLTPEEEQNPKYQRYMWIYITRQNTTRDKISRDLNTALYNIQVWSQRYIDQSPDKKIPSGESAKKNFEQNIIKWLQQKLPELYIYNVGVYQQEDNTQDKTSESETTPYDFFFVVDNMYVPVNVKLENEMESRDIQSSSFIPYWMFKKDADFFLGVIKEFDYINKKQLANTANQSYFKEYYNVVAELLSQDQPDTIIQPRDYILLVGDIQNNDIKLLKFSEMLHFNHVSYKYPTGQKTIANTFDDEIFVQNTIRYDNQRLFNEYKDMLFNSLKGKDIRDSKKSAKQHFLYTFYHNYITKNPMHSYQALKTMIQGIDIDTIQKMYSLIQNPDQKSDAKKMIEETIKKLQAIH